MNRNYRQIWNKTLGRLVVASETARSNGKSTLSSKIIVLGSVPVLLSVAAPSALAANSDIGIKNASSGLENTLYVNNVTNPVTANRLNSRTVKRDSSQQNRNSNGDGAVGDGSIAEGDNAYASKPAATAIGTGATANGTGSIALGHNAFVDSTSNGGDSNFSIAIGDSSHVLGGTSFGSIAMGFNAYSGNDIGAGSQSIAIGANSKAINHSTTGSPIAIGVNSDASGNGAQISLGDNSSASGFNAVAIGGNPNSTATAAKGDRSLALGPGANTSAGSLYGIAIGNTSYTNGQNTTAVGANAQALANNSSAFGTGALANQNGATAFGNNAQATGQNGSAFGQGASAEGEGSAIGHNAHSTSDGAAIGPNSTATGTGSAAIGSGANVTAEKGVAVGGGAKVSQVGGVALGVGSNADRKGGQDGYIPGGSSATQRQSILDTRSSDQYGGVDVGKRQITGVAAGSADSDAVNVSQLKAGLTHYYSVNDGGNQTGNYNNDGATGTNSLAAGTGASAQNDNATAVGNNTYVDGNGSTAIGSGAEVKTQDDSTSGSKTGATHADQATAIGYNAKSNYLGASAIGSGASTGGINSTVLGNNASTTGNDATAVGTRASAAEYGTALGEETNATGLYSLASGFQTDASGEYALASGYQAKAIGGSSTAVGFGAQSQGDSSSAFGNSAKAEGTRGLALGAEAVAGADYSIAEGYKANTSKNNWTTAIGNYASATGESATALGNRSSSTGTSSNAIGNGANASANNAQAIGTSANASGINTLAEGSGATASNANATAIGNSANAGGSSAIALGSGSKASDTAALALGNNANASNANSVALGSGSSTAGANPTSEGTVGGTTYQYAGTNPGSVVSVGSSGNERQITNVAAGRVSDSSTDAINGSQLYATNQGVDNATNIANTANTTANKGWNVSTNGDTSSASNVAPGDNVDFSNKDKNLTISHDGNNVNVDLASDLNLGNTTINQNGATTYTGPINEGDDITNKNYVDNSIQQNKTRYYSVNDNGNQQDNYNDDGATGNNALAAGVASSASGEHATAVGNGTSATGTSATALGDGATASDNNSVALGSNSSTAAANPTSEGTVGGTTYQYAGTNPGSVVSVGSSGNERQITNVAAGRVSDSSTDAINGSQLYATNQGVDNATNIANTANTTANKGWNVSTNGDTSSASNVAPGDNVDFSNKDKNLTISHDGNNVNVDLASDLNLGNTTINQNGATTYTGPINEGDDITNKNYVDNSIQQNKTRYYSVNDNGNQQDNYNDDGATGNNALAAGVASSASGEHATAVGNGTSATGTSATALGDGATASNNDSVALGSNSSTAAANPTSEGTVGGTTYQYAGTNPNSVVSVGSSGNERQITNVAAGRVSDSSTDAINGSQLYATNQGVDNATNIANTANTTANKGWNVSTNGESSNASNVAPGSTVDFTPTNNNLTVSHDGDNVKLGLADNLDLGDNGSITTGNTTINNDGLKNGNTTVNGDGVSITNGPSITTNGVDAGNHKITNVSPGDISQNSTDAVNGSQLYQQGNDLTQKGLTFAGDSGNSVHRDLGQTVNVKGNAKNADDLTDGNIGVVADGNDTLNVKLNKDVDLGGNGSVTAGNTTINNGGVTTNNLNVGGTTKLGDNFEIHNGGETTYNGPITNGDDITNKNYVDNSIQQNKTRYYSVNDNGNQQDNYNDDGATGNNALAAGVGSSASGEHATAVGNGTSATGTSATALGDGATASENNSVALGSGSSTAAANPTSEGTVGGTTYQYAGTNPGSVVSVGSSGNERQITNVAAGRVSDSSTDAINGSQLYATNKAVDNATDTANNANRGWNVSTNGESSNASNVAPGSTVDFTPTNKNLTVSHDGDNVKLGLADNLDLGDNGSITTGNTTINNDGLKNGNTTVNGDGVTINGGPSITTNGVDAGGDKITNVAPGTDGTDAVNVNQLNNQSTDLTNKGLDFAGDSGTNVHRDLGQTVNVKGNAKNADDLTDGNIGVVADGNNTLNVKLNKDVDLGGNGSVTAGNTTINNGGVTTNNLNVGGTTKLGDNFEIHNGGETTYNGPITNGDDVTNKNYVDNSIQQNKTRYYSVNDNGNQQANYNDDGATGNNALAAGVGSSASGEHATAVGNGTSATGTSATALGDGATASENNSVALGSGSSTAAANPTSEGTVGGTTYHYAGTNPNSVVSVGSSGNERQITNVAAGRVSDSSTDAINGSQLYATNQGVDNATNIANTANTTANKGWNVSTNGESSNASNVAPGSTVDFTPTNKNLTVSHDGDNVKLGLADNLDLGDNGSITAGNTTINNDGLKNGNTTVNGDGVTINGGPSITTNGVDAGGDKITNVAPGTNGTDAVNVNQLNNQSTDLTNKGLDFAGDAGTNVHRDLGQTVNVKGNAKNADDLTDGNIGVVADGNDTLNVKLNKDINLGDNGSVTTGNTTINNGGFTNGNTTVNGDGLTIAGGPSVTTNGVDAGGKKITNVAPGTDGTDAVNVNQLTDVSNVANKGWNVSTNGDSKGASNVAPGSTVDFTPTNKNLTVSHDGDNVKLGLADNLDLGDNGSITTGSTTINNDGLTNGNTTVNGDGVTINGGPSITTNGVDAGGDKITNVAPGTDGTDAVNVNQLNNQSTDLTNKGLDFAGDSGTNVHRDLGQTVNVKGNAKNADDLTDGNIGVVADGNDTLNVKLNKDVDLGGNGSVTAGNTTINNGGVTTNSLNVANNTFQVHNDGETTYNGPITNGDDVTNKNYVDNSIQQNKTRYYSVNDNGNQQGNYNDDGAKGNNALAAGVDTSATGQQSTAVGTKATATGEGALALGNNATSTGQGAYAGGQNSVASGTNALALGHASVANADNATALGDGAVAKNNGSVALGNGSVTAAANPTSEGTVGGTTYQYAGTNPSSVVSVGSGGHERQITNVAAGRVSDSSTDAINGSQLYATNKAVDNATDTANKGWNVSTNGDAKGASNVAPGSTVDFTPTNKNLTVSHDGDNVKLGLADNLDLGDNGSITTGSTTINNDGLTNGNTTVNGDGVTINGGPSITTNGVDAGGDKITNVAPGTDGTDAVNVNQLNNQSTDLTNKGLNFAGDAGTNVHRDLGQTVNVKGNAKNADDLTDGNIGVVADGNDTLNVKLNKDVNLGDNGSVTTGNTTINNDGLSINNGPSITQNGIDGGNKQITNVAAGTKGTDAVNVNQLTDVSNVANKGWNVSTNGDSKGASNVAPGSTVDFTPTNKNLTVSHDGDNVKLGLADNLDLGDNGTVKTGNTTINNDGLTNGNTTVNGDGVTINGGPSITTNGVNAGGDKITNVAPGTDGTDAVNVNQLNNQSTDLTNKGLDFAGDSGTNVHRDLGQTVNVKGNAKNADDLTDGNIGVVADGNDTLNVKLNKDVNLGDNGSVTTGNTTINNDGLSINNGPSITQNGIDGGNKQITNVAAGTKGTDAVNVNQLTDVSNVANKGWNVSTNGDSKGASNVAPGSTVDFTPTNKNLTVSHDGDNVKLGLADNLDLGDNGTVKTGNTTINNDGLTNGNTTVNGDGVTINGGPSITTNGVDAGGDKITNVAPGTDGTDAVNVNQLNNQSTDLTNKGLDFAGDSGTNVHRDLGQTVNVKGNAKNADDLTDGNIGVVADGNDTLNVKLNKDVNLGDNGSVTTGNTTINNDGLSINNGPSITQNGIDGGNKQITNVAAGTKGTDAVNVNQLTDVSNVANKGWNVSTNGDSKGASNVAPGSTVDFTPTNKNLTVSHDGDNVKLGLADNLDLGDNGSITTGNTTINNDGVTNGNTTLNGNGVSITNGPSITTSGIDAGGSQITNVKAGTAGTDAVNVNQLHDQNNDLTNKGLTFAGDSGDNVHRNLGQTVSIKGGADNSKDLTKGNIGVVANGNDTLTVALNKDVNLGSDGSLTTGNTTVNNSGLSITNGPSVTSNGIDAGGKTITNVAPGKNGTDAANINQLTDVSNVANKGWNVSTNGDSKDASKVAPGDTVDFTPTNKNLTINHSGNNVSVGLADNLNLGDTGSIAMGNTIVNSDGLTNGNTTVNNNGLTIKGGPSVTSNGVDAGGKKVTNVADGDISSTSTDAVNGSQLWSVQQDASAGWNLTTNGGQDKTNIAPGGTVDIGTAPGEKNLKVTQNGSNVQVSMNNNLDLGKDGSVKTGNTTVNNDGVTIANGPSMTSSGINAGGDKITNVADGDVSQNSTDAVNGSQLWNAEQNINNITTNGTKYFHANSDEADSQANGSNSVAIGPEAVADGASSIASGEGATAKGSAAVASGAHSKAEANNATALGANADAKSSGGVALGANSVADRSGMNGKKEAFSGTTVNSTQGAVSVGSAGNERQITNVAGGTEDTDAVNVRQLKSVQQGAVNYDKNADGTTNYNSVTMKGDGGTQIHNVAAGTSGTDAANVNQLDQLGNNLVHRMRDVKQDADAGTASALAAANLPQSMIPGKSMISAGAGTYQGQSAVSVGLSRLSDNGRVVFKGSMTGDTQGHFGAGVGVGWQW